MDLSEIGQRFLERRPIPNVAFEHNDYVAIVGGENVGKFGSLVTVAALEPETIFVVELESGHDVQVPQSLLKRVHI